MANEITLWQGIQVANGNFQFPKFGNTPAQVNQATAIGGAPGLILAVTAANGTLVDLSTLPTGIWSAALGGFLCFKNIDSTNFVTWGPDNGAGTLIKQGEMLPGEIAGPFRASRGNSKIRFQADTGNCNVMIFAMAP